MRALATWPAASWPQLWRRGEPGGRWAVWCHHRPEGSSYSLAWECEDSSLARWRPWNAGTGPSQSLSAAKTLGTDSSIGEDHK
jgi:hypothetical protein